MPQYLVIRVSEIPALDTMASANVLRVNGADEADALQQAATKLKEAGTDPAVYGVTLASNITRRVVTATHSYTVT